MGDDFRLMIRSSSFGSSPARSPWSWALLASAGALLGACGTSGSSSPPVESAVTVSASSSTRAVPAAPTLRVVFREGKAFAREGGREWAIAEVGRDEMLWAPDGQRFAYLRKDVRSAPLSSLGLASKPAKPGRSRSASAGAPALPADLYHVVIRNLRGDSVNEFPAYRPGRPSDLDWVDNEQLAYLAPSDASGDAYVIHSVTTGEVLKVLRGSRFVWSPGRKQLAYVSGKRGAEQVLVSGQAIWPRPGAATGKRKIVGELSWSPDGGGLAFMEQLGRTSQLVVLLVLGDKDGDLSWPLPAGALDPEHHLFWLEGKVLIGRSSLQPRFAASWKRLR